MATIDFTKPNTYPQCFWVVIDEWSQTNDNKVKEIQKLAFRDDEALQRAFYKHFRDFQTIERQLFDSLEGNRIFAYHGTKVESLSSIKYNGLFLSRNIYLNQMKNFFFRHNIPYDDLDELMEKLSAYYDEKYSDNPQQLCFVLNMKQFDSSLKKYDVFLRNIVGELARWTYEEDYPEIFKLLCENGESCIVKVNLPLKNISPDFQSQLIKRMLFKVFVEKFICFNVEVFGEAKTKMIVPPEDILDIIPVKKS